MNDEVRLDPRLELAQEGDPDELVEVVVRLRRPGLAPPGLEVVGDLGEIVTGRVLRGEIARVHDHEDVESMKTGELVVPEPDAMPAGDEVGAEAAEADGRRPRRDPATGRGSIVAVVDWWFDLAQTPAVQAPAAGAAPPRVPVHPLILALRDPGQLAFDILAGRPREYADELLSDEFEILALPGGRLAEALRPGDLIVSWADGAPGESSLAVVASPLSLAPDETEAFGAGEEVETIDPTDWNGGRPQRVRVLTAEGAVPADCIALRVRPIPGEVPGATALVAPSGEIAIESAVDDRLAAVAGCTLDPYRYDSTGEACADGPAVGTRALKRLLLERFGTRRAGIYNCRNVRGGRSLSLHAEGRAIDYYLDAHNAAERAVGDGLVSWLLQPDAAGNPHAHARRLGVQEVIWNRQIWSAGRRRDQGLRPYRGPSPHEDHVHIGQHRLGAMMRTSYWAGC